MSHAEATPCKLPLLDGDDTTDPRLLVVEKDLANVERRQGFSTGDVASVKDLLCTAWGLLLRCFTGQDEVSFHFRQDTIDNLVSNSAAPRTFQSIFQMVFDEHDSLATCLAKAKDGYAGNEQRQPSLVSSGTGSTSLSATGHQNTHVWVQDANAIDAQNVAVDKVFPHPV